MKINKSPLSKEEFMENFRVMTMNQYNNWVKRNVSHCSVWTIVFNSAKNPDDLKKIIKESTKMSGYLLKLFIPRDEEGGNGYIATSRYPDVDFIPPEEASKRIGWIITNEPSDRLYHTIFSKNIEESPRIRQQVPSKFAAIAEFRFSGGCMSMAAQKAFYVFQSLQRNSDMKECYMIYESTVENDVFGFGGMEAISRTSCFNIDWKFHSFLYLGKPVDKARPRWVSDRKNKDDITIEE